MPASSKFLNPEAIARLHGLELRARALAAGPIAGMHRSPYRGYSVEFAEHRAYVPGDDIRHIDWRLYGRKDRFFIKQYDEETNLRCDILLDVSRSMLYGGAPNKFDYARMLAASIAYLIVHQQDAAGLLTFDHEVRTTLRAATGRTQLAHLLEVLEAAAPTGQTDVKILFHRLAEELKHRSMVVLISDLLTDPEDVAAGLEHIAFAGHELIVLHVMDDTEWNFPFLENVQFEGLEDDLRLLVDPQSLRASYLAAVERFVKRVRTACLKHGADYVAINTRDPVDVVLRSYLGRRARRGGGGTRRR